MDIYNLPNGFGRKEFQTTHWSLVLAAARTGHADSDKALGQLFEGYWYPLFSFARRSGHQFDEAQDATQAFFTALIEKEILHEITQEGGRFRSFLLKVFTRFLANQWRATQSAKRGGGQKILSLDFEQAEQRYQNEPFHEITPDHLFERQWAMTLIDRSLSVLHAEYERKGNLPLFNQLRSCLGRQNESSYQESAAGLGMTEGAFKTAVHRFRGRFASLLRQEIADTVNAPEEVEDELRSLFQTLRARS